MKQILVKISSVVESGMGCWLFTHYCLFPDSHTTHRYDVRASSEGFGAMCSIWRKAGYEIVFENEYPR